MSHVKGRTPELRQAKTTVTIYTTREQPPIAKIGYLVKVFTNTTTATRIESQPAPASEKRKEKKRDLVCLKAL